MIEREFRAGTPVIGVRPPAEPSRSPTAGGRVQDVDFAPSAVADDYTKRMRAFLDESILPAEAEYDA